MPENVITACNPVETSETGSFSESHIVRIELDNKIGTLDCER
jgi:hypothetical protein